jgi:Zn-dependent protease
MSNKNQSVKIKILLFICSLAILTFLCKEFFLALGILSMLFVHESGHLFAAKRLGYKTKGMYFLPGLGAAAIIDIDTIRKWKDECYISIMGPLFGSIYSCLFLILFFITGIETLLYIAGVSAIINLFNFIPINPLDGGRILKSILFSMGRIIGLGAMFIMSICSLFLFVKWHYIFLFVAIFSFLDFLRECKKDKDITQTCIEKGILSKKDNQKVFIQDYHKYIKKMNFFEILLYCVMCLVVIGFLLQIVYVFAQEAHFLKMI